MALWRVALVVVECWVALNVIVIWAVLRAGGRRR